MRKIIIALAIFTLIKLSVGNAQTTVIQIPDNAFWIQSGMSYGTPGGCWHIPGAPTIGKNGQIICVWDITNGVDRLYSFNPQSKEGYYLIKSSLPPLALSYIGNPENKIPYYVNVINGSSTKGTNVQLFFKPGTKAQLFKIVHLGNGKMKIYTESGKVLGLSGSSSKNGSLLQICDDSDHASNTWYFVDPATSRAFIPNADQVKLLPPSFFITNKNKTLKFSTGGNGWRSEGTAKIVSLTDKMIKLSVTSTKSFQDGARGVEETVINKTYEQILDYKGDGYYYADSYKSSENEINNPEEINICMDQNCITISVIKKETFFTSNKIKTFEYESGAMDVGAKGTAKVISIVGNVITLNLTSYTMGPDYFQKKNAKKTLIKLEYKDGKYYKLGKYPQIGTASLKELNMQNQGEGEQAMGYASFKLQ
ncbi:MAG: RICIN domain-containing protein [Bacteroidales bacterium]|nr:RICIN domain-containing protein [Bacteroidales bacterium]